MEGNLSPCGQRREICKCTSKLNIRVFFFHHLKVYNVPFIKKKRFFRNLFSSSFFVLTRSGNFFFAPKKTDWPLLHMPEKNSFPQSRFSVVTQQSTTQISHVKTEWDKSRNTTSRHFRKIRKLSRVNFRKDLGTGQRYWPIAERRVLSNDPRSLCEIWFSPVSLSFLKWQIAPAFPSYTPFPPPPPPPPQQIFFPIPAIFNAL